MKASSHSYSNKADVIASVGTFFRFTGWYSFRHKPEPKALAICMEQGPKKLDILGFNINLMSRYSDSSNILIIPEYFTLSLCYNLLFLYINLQVIS
jgi:hypothetical protein